MGVAERRPIHVHKSACKSAGSAVSLACPEQEVQEVLVPAVQRFADPIQLKNNSYLARVQACSLFRWHHECCSPGQA